MPSPRPQPPLSSSCLSGTPSGKDGILSHGLSHCPGCLRLTVAPSGDCTEHIQILFISIPVMFYKTIIKLIAISSSISIGNDKGGGTT